MLTTSRTIAAAALLALAACGGSSSPSPPECAVAADCPGDDTACRLRTCVSGACGALDLPAGPAADQVAGDCREARCDGAGDATSVARDDDLPPSDGSGCTAEACLAGAPQHPPLPADTPCATGGGAFCDGAGACVECNAAAQCPGEDSECRSRTCLSHACGVVLADAGTPLSAQVAGDCVRSACDGLGGVAVVNDDADVPVDGDACTQDLCADGIGSHPPSPLGTPCDRDGGTVCDGRGACLPAPAVAATAPADGATATPPSGVSVAFTLAMDPSTLTGQTAAGPCAGSLQLSADGFATCAPFASATPAMSDGDTLATFAPAPALLLNRTYRLRVTTAAASAAGIPLPVDFVQAAGFGTPPPVCGGASDVVVSQVYAGGGTTSSTAAYRYDFAELHNRGATTANLLGWSLQYQSAGSVTAWSSRLLLNGSIPPGGYFLVRLGSASSSAPDLPGFDQASSAFSMSAAGKLALVGSTTNLAAGCPPVGPVLDLVGWGAANCAEGGAAAPQLLETAAALRRDLGCADTDVNAADFTVGTPLPRWSATPPFACACRVANESGSGSEADLCAVQSPASLALQAGAPSGPVTGRVLEAGVTESAGADPGVVAEVGWGPATANPEIEAGWTWTPAAFASQQGDGDEYEGSFTAPAAGTYRFGYRVSVDAGAAWTYCDADGAGAADGYAFDPAALPALEVAP